MDTNPACLEQLEPASLSQVLLMAALCNPEDGRPDNYVLEPMTTAACGPDGSQQLPLFRVVCVDNDHVSCSRRHASTCALIAVICTGCRRPRMRPIPCSCWRTEAFSPLHV